MLKKVVGFLLIIFCITLVLSPPVFAEEIHTTGKANIVIDVATGRILHEKNIHEKLPMASTTKIMTALLAIENMPLDKKVKIHPEAEGVEGSSIYLKANEKIKMIDLLYGLMLRSGNDVATAIAYEVSGSVEEFAKLMNLRAKELGANNTNFVNPHGLSHNDHYTTAYDLAIITREALRNPTFKEVVKTKFWLAERDGYQHFTNKNKILNICEGGDGVKTGYTIKAGRCLVASATRNNMQFIAVTLNDGDWFNTTNKLLDYSFNQYKPYTVFKAQDLIKTIMVKNGVKTTMYLEAAKELIVPIQEEEEGKILSIIQAPETVSAPVIKGQRIGKISTYLDGELINSTYLLAKEDIERLTTKDKFLRFFKFK
ncbi:D-alanyl-D-alanine carboxypeptidase (penicillin-binding protein 5/6) [Anaerovirgula multivorans]|uniref:serine-type D-Ala-D-Ala carboxypeptidase n=1 Tax=Anaerovirgula multivorans TaxID=312168 RepID=A0A238ZV50_9FIRM|nr:D-alanyl-D-alanine carboxypeptidase family protein [Anaerovirgula multivorans]SNR87287.1 D-alanyl-D-alanine carboxypeptidase (penicillin-binding protein 5/6) [Anaerovirgula multivorans]